MRYGTEAFALGGLTETLTTGSASQDLCGKRCRSWLQVRCTASLIGRRLFISGRPAFHSLARASRSRPANLETIARVAHNYKHCGIVIGTIEGHAIRTPVSPAIFLT